MVVWSKDMKIKKSQLRRIIQEEINRTMTEQAAPMAAPPALRATDLQNIYGIQMVPAMSLVRDPQALASLDAKGREIQSILDRAGLGNIGHRQFRNLWGDNLSGYGAPWGPRGVFTAAGNMASGQRVPDLSIMHPRPYRLGTETQELFGMLRRIGMEDLNALQRAAQEFRAIHDDHVARNRDSIVRSSSMIPSN